MAAGPQTDRDAQVPRFPRGRRPGVAKGDRLLHVLAVLFKERCHHDNPAQTSTTLREDLSTSATLYVDSRHGCSIETRDSVVVLYRCSQQIVPRSSLIDAAEVEGHIKLETDYTYPMR